MIFPTPSHGIFLQGIPQEFLLPNTIATAPSSTATQASKDSDNTTTTKIDNLNLETNTFISGQRPVMDRFMKDIQKYNEEKRRKEK